MHCGILGLILGLGLSQTLTTFIKVSPMTASASPWMVLTPHADHCRSSTP